MSAATPQAFLTTEITQY